VRVCARVSAYVHISAWHVRGSPSLICQGRPSTTFMGMPPLRVHIGIGAGLVYGVQVGRFPLALAFVADEVWRSFALRCGTLWLGLANGTR
jgi:hypothetical protein